MTPLELQEFAQDVVCLSAFSGALGAVLVLLVFAVLRGLADWVTGSDWWLDRLDRAYVRRLNKGRTHSGRSLVVLLVLISGLAVAVAACTPSPLTASHNEWRQRIQAASW